MLKPYKVTVKVDNISQSYMSLGASFTNVREREKHFWPENTEITVTQDLSEHLPQWLRKKEDDNAKDIIQSKK